MEPEVRRMDTAAHLSELVQEPSKVSLSNVNKI